jgi:hypothetical protein
VLTYILECLYKTDKRRCVAVGTPCICNGEEGVVCLLINIYEKSVWIVRVSGDAIEKYDNNSFSGLF